MLSSFVDSSRSKKFGGDAALASQAAHRAQAAEQDPTTFVLYVHCPGQPYTFVNKFSFY